MHLKSIITASGGIMDNVVMLGIFILDDSQIQMLRDNRNRFINPENPPASTFLQASNSEQIN